MIEWTPSEEEIREAVHELTELVQGKNGINISYIRKEGKELEERIVKTAQVIKESPPER